MKTAETYTDKFENDFVTTSNNSGLFLASDPFNYTATTPQSVVLIGSLCDFERVVRALDNLPDEIGITHELVHGEISEINENHR